MHRFRKNYVTLPTGNDAMVISLGGAVTKFISQAMAMLNRPLAFYGETCVFPPVGLEKPMEIFTLEPFLVYVIALVRLTNTPNLVEIGSQGAPHSGEMSRFCDFWSAFIPFPHLAYRSQLWTDSHV